MESRPGQLRRSIAAAVAAAFNSGAHISLPSVGDDKPPPDKRHPRKHRPSKAKRKARRKMQRESRRRNRR